MREITVVISTWLFMVCLAPSHLFGASPGSDEWLKIELLMTNIPVDRTESGALFPSHYSYPYSAWYRRLLGNATKLQTGIPSITYIQPIAIPLLWLKDTIRITGTINNLQFFRFEDWRKGGLSDSRRKRMNFDYIDIQLDPDLQRTLRGMPGLLDIDGDHGDSTSYTQATGEPETQFPFIVAHKPNRSSEPVFFLRIPAYSFVAIRTIRPVDQRFRHRSLTHCVADLAHLLVP